MSADDASSAERQDLFPDRREDRLGVASPEVRPTDRAPEERVAGKRGGLIPEGVTPPGSLGAEQEALDPGVWPGVVDRLEWNLPTAIIFAVFEPGVGGNCPACARARRTTPGRESVLERPVAVVDPDRGPVASCHSRRAADVVEVPVRVKQSDRPALASPRARGGSVGFVAPGR